MHKLMYTDWSDDAAWVGTSVSDDAFDLIKGRQIQSVLTAMPGWRLSRVRIDTMHVNNLGIAWYVVGNLLWFLTYYRAYRFLEPARGKVLAPTAEYDLVLKDLQLRFKSWLSRERLDCSTPRFNLRNIHRAESTDTCLFRLKASKSPFLVSWLSELFADLCEALPGYVPWIRKAEVAHSCVYGMAMFFFACRTQPRVFDIVKRVEVHDWGKMFLYMYSEMHRFACDDNQGETLWHFIPKFHLFDHVLRDIKIDGENPAYFHCFGDEDMVGQMLQVAAAGHASTTVSSAVGKYSLGLKVRLTDKYKEWIVKQSAQPNG